MFFAAIKKKHKIMLFAIWFQLEIITLSQSEKQIPCDITYYLWNLKYDTK